MAHEKRGESVIRRCRMVLKNADFSSNRLAEGEGFEPPVGCPTAVFKTAAIDRTRPSLRATWSVPSNIARVGATTSGHSRRVARFRHCGDGAVIVWQMRPHPVDRVCVGAA